MRKSKKSALVWLKCCILVLSVNFFAHIKTKGLERKIAPISRKLSKTFNNLSSSLQSTYSKQQHDSTEDGSVHCKMAVIPDNSYIIMLKENSSEADLEAVISLLKSKPFNGKVESEFKALKGFSVVLDEAVTKTKEFQNLSAHRLIAVVEKNQIMTALNKNDDCAEAAASRPL